MQLSFAGRPGMLLSNVLLILSLGTATILGGKTRKKQQSQQSTSGCSVNSGPNNVVIPLDLTLGGGENLEDYRKFLKELREHYRQRHAPGGFTEVELSYRGQSARLVLRDENLYLVGVVSGDTLYALERDGLPPAGRLSGVRRTTDLNMGANYGDLGRVAGIDIQDVPVNIYSLRQAVNVFSKWTRQTNKTWAKDIMRMIVFICEAARFHAIANGIVQDVESSGSFKLGTSLDLTPGKTVSYMDLVNNWARLSLYDSTSSASDWTLGRSSFPRSLLKDVLAVPYYSCPKIKNNSKKRP